MDLELSFREVVRLIRTRIGMTQLELSEVVGKPKHWIVDIERGKVTPIDSKSIAALSRSLEVDMCELWALAFAERFGASSHWPSVVRDIMVAQGVSHE